MTIFLRLAFLFIAFCFLLNFPLPVQAEEGSQYGQWQSSNDRLKNMINDLNQIIEEGTRSRAAHPGFLQDLNRIIDQYRIPQKSIFFADDFADNNFAENPTWTVRKGIFSIDSFGSLYSSIATRRPVAEKETEPESESDRNLRILFGVLNELAKDENGQQGQDGNIETQAMISSAAIIPNSFNLGFSFKSNGDWGSTSIGVTQGDDPQSGYHLVYQASPEENRPMQLIKYRYGKQYIIDEIPENSPNLDDGADHNVHLTRSPNGDMVVTIDNIEVMRTSDFSYRGDFASVIIINNGGKYSYDNIEFFIEQ
jgi:hypothetical protein